MEDFASLLAESLAKDDLFEGSVVKGKIVSIVKDMAVIDVTPEGLLLKELAPGISARSSWLAWALPTRSSSSATSASCSGAVT